MSFDIALSTMWSVGRFPHLGDFFEAGKELGFARFELNHAISSDMLAGLSLNGTITAVHEPCPADIPAQELKKRNWLISALDEESRRQGVLATQRSIDLAHELGAGAVIVHPGRVDIDPTLEPELVRLYRAGEFGQPEYDEAKERLVVARATQAALNMQSVRRSLLELAEYAAKLDVRLGLENRFHYDEIPLPDEVHELLDLDSGGTIGYWHDVGHGQVLEHQGFFSHEEWLRRFSTHMIGIHLHDVLGVEDHLAVGLGQVDWNLVFRYLPDGVLRTCEFKSINSPQEVAAGLRRLLDREHRKEPQCPL